MCERATAHIRGDGKISQGVSREPRQKMKWKSFFFASPSGVKTLSFADDGSSGGENDAMVFRGEERRRERRLRDVFMREAVLCINNSSSARQKRRARKMKNDGSFGAPAMLLFPSMEFFFRVASHFLLPKRLWSRCALAGVFCNSFLLSHKNISSITEKCCSAIAKSSL